MRRWQGLLVLALTAAAWSPSSGLKVALRGSDRQDLKHVEFCVSCDNPVEHGGSHVWGLGAVHGPQNFAIMGELVYAVPNDGSGEFINIEDIEGSIVMMDRGAVSMLSKILLAQRSGAKGVLLVDNGQCSVDLRDCGLIGGSDRGGFAGRDKVQEWKEVRIPSVLVHEVEGMRIKGLLRLREVTVADYGVQLVPR